MWKQTSLPLNELLSALFFQPNNLTCSSLHSFSVFFPRSNQLKVVRGVTCDDRTLQFRFCTYDSALFGPPSVRGSLEPSTPARLARTWPSWGENSCFSTPGQHSRGIIIIIIAASWSPVKRSINQCNQSWVVPGPDSMWSRRSSGVEIITFTKFNQRGLDAEGSGQSFITMSAFSRVFPLMSWKDWGKPYPLLGTYLGADAASDLVQSWPEQEGVSNEVSSGWLIVLSLWNRYLFEKVQRTNWPNNS